MHRLFATLIWNESNSLGLIPNSPVVAGAAPQPGAGAYGQVRPQSDVPGSPKKASDVAIIPVPAAAGWSDSRVGLSPTGKTPPLHGARSKWSFFTGLGEHFITLNYEMPKLV